MLGKIFMNTRQLIFLSTLCMAATALAVTPNRGLHVAPTAEGDALFVSWRMRAGDAQVRPTYQLFADGQQVASLTDSTNVLLPLSYKDATFSLSVVDGEGFDIDQQREVKADTALYHDIRLEAPKDIRELGAFYTPNDASACDMDGDGEEEIILKWDPSNAHDNAHRGQTSPVYLDCYKLSGERLWRICLGVNIRAGAHYTQFLCYDFDGDGRGELIVKTAPGTTDGTGAYLSKGIAQGADHGKAYYDKNGMVARGPEWLTCFSGRDGRELMTTDYWPHFDIQSDWDHRPDNVDGADKANRGCRFKACVAVLPVQGEARPCAVMNRGYYTYSYFSAYTWDGRELSTVWHHASEKPGEGTFGEGAHSLSVGDVDQDGYDEILVGAACLDHDGTTLWRTGLGHGDALHLGDFDPANPGLEVYRVTEDRTAYDACLMDARTGKVLSSLPIIGGDVGRGTILDCDPNYPGAEYLARSRKALFTCGGDSIAPWRSGAINNHNFRIFWDGDLLEEYHDHRYVSKWDPTAQTWRMLTDMRQWGARSCNGSKDTPVLQTDLYGDWREEVIYYVIDGGQFSLRIFTTSITTPHMLPWLRDDHVYDMSVVWQNCAYNQPPHLGYNLF